MGTTESKNTENTGDPQVQVLNQLSVHEELHVQHDTKLNIVIIIVAIQLVITLYRAYKDHAQKQALKAAKSISALNRLSDV